MTHQIGVESGQESIYHACWAYKAVADINTIPLNKFREHQRRKLDASNSEAQYTRAQVLN